MGDDSTTIPHLSITIDDKDINSGALRVLQAIRPRWDPSDVDFKLLTDGITNKLVGCRPKDEDAAETVLVRVYGNKTDLLIDRKAETRNILLLSNIGLAPNLYATFSNGLAYQFVPGCTLTDGTVKHPDICKLVAVRMAKLHKVQVPGESNPQPFIWTKLRSFFNLVPDNFSDISKDNRFRKVGPSKVKIQAEMEYLEGALTDSTFPVVFCHNDLLLGNVVYTEEKNCVTFIDFEYAAYNYQAFDIANHFLEFAGVEDVDYNKYPSKEFQFDWLKTYLEEYKGGYSEDDVDRLYHQVNKFVLVSHLFWGIWALIQTEHSYIDFDFLGYATIRFDEYFAKKEELISLGELPR
jgi:ethanolamine kinase